MNKISFFTAAAIAAFTLCGCGINGEMKTAGNSFRDAEMKTNTTSKSAELLKKSAEQWKKKDFEGCLKSRMAALSCADLNDERIRENTKLDIIRTLIELKQNDEAKACIAEITGDEKASAELKIQALYVKCDLERNLKEMEKAVLTFREIRKQGDSNPGRLASYQNGFAGYLKKAQFGCDPAELRTEVYHNTELPENVRMEAFIGWSDAKGLRFYPEKLETDIIPEFRKYFPTDKIS